MLTKAFKKHSTTVAAAILTVASLVSYVLGLVRDMVLANYFGAGVETDAYNSAFLVPDTIFNFFVAAALSAAFIPIFSEYLAKDKEDARELATSFLTLVSVFMIALMTIAFFAMPAIIGWYFADASQEKISLIIDLSRILLLSPLLFAISNTFGNILLSYKHFTAYAIAPLLYNIGIISGIVCFGKTYGIYAAAYGAVIGIALHGIARFIEMMRATDFRLTPRMNFVHPGIKKIGLLMIPRTVSLLLWQLSLWVINIVAQTKLVTGSLAAFNFARNIQSFPVSIFGISLATAVFPFLSDHVVLERKDHFTRHYQKALQQVLFYTIPAAAGIFMLATPIVKLLFFHGAFTEEDLAMTALVLKCFAFSIPFESMVHLMVRAFYAHKNTIIPVCAQVFFVGSIIAGSYYAAPKMGAQAFSLFFTIGAVMQVIVLALLLRKHLRGFQFGQLVKTLSIILLALFTMVVIIVILDGTAWPSTVKIGAQILGGAAAYLGIAWYMCCDELSYIQKLWQKFRRV